MNRILIRNGAEVSYLLKNMADSEKKDIEDMMAVLAQMEEKAKNMETLVVVRKQVECAKPPEKSDTRPKILGISGFRTQKVILNKSHGELSIRAIHNRQILADIENCNFQKLKVHEAKLYVYNRHFCISINLNLCQNRPKISHLMTHIKWLWQQQPKQGWKSRTESSIAIRRSVLSIV